MTVHSQSATYSQLSALFKTENPSEYDLFRLVEQHGLLLSAFQPATA
jgi:hypothetical protein